jgi:hypothetical protein
MRLINIVAPEKDMCRSSGDNAHRVDGICDCFLWGLTIDTRSSFSTSALAVMLNLAQAAVAVLVVFARWYIHCFRFNFIVIGIE